MPNQLPDTIQTVEVSTGAFRVSDEGPRDAPVVVFAHSLGTTLGLWNPQARQLSATHRVIRYDARGHGGSIVSQGPYSVEELAGDVLHVLDALEVTQFAFCGISMGGITGLTLALKAPERLTHLIVANSAAKLGEQATWVERAQAVRKGGAATMAEMAESAAGRWFTPAFAEAHSGVVAWAKDAVQSTAPEGYAACCDALGAVDLRGELHRIATPTLLIAGEHDAGTTVADAELMQTGISGAQLRILPSAHMSCLECAADFNAAVSQFVQRA